MKCTICNNSFGFTCGTCIECGYNYIDHTYHFIKVDTNVLKSAVSPRVFNLLVSEHERYNKDRKFNI